MDRTTSMMNDGSRINFFGGIFPATGTIAQNLEFDGEIGEQYRASAKQLLTGQKFNGDQITPEEINVAIHILKTLAPRRTVNLVADGVLGPEMKDCITSIMNALS